MSYHPHVGQEFRLKLETNITLTGSTLLIKYRDPAGTEGSFTAIIDPADNSKMYYDFQSTDTTDLDGDWFVWAHAVRSDSTIDIGQSVKLTIYPEGYSSY